MKKKKLQEIDNVHPLVMPEEYWATSQFSVARYYGRIGVNGHEYIIVNKEGKDIFECSLEAEREGREKAIEPGEPCDLVLRELIPLYRKMGRDAIIDALRNGSKPSELLEEFGL